MKHCSFKTYFALHLDTLMVISNALRSPHRANMKRRLCLVAWFGSGLLRWVLSSQEALESLCSKEWLLPPAPPAHAALVLEWPACATVFGQQGGHFFIHPFICLWGLFPMTCKTSVCLIQMLSHRRSAIELAFASIWRMNYGQNEWCWHLKIF